MKTRCVGEDLPFRALPLWPRERIVRAFRTAVTRGRPLRRSDPRTVTCGWPIVVRITDTLQYPSPLTSQERRRENIIELILDNTVHEAKCVCVCVCVCPAVPVVSVHPPAVLLLQKGPCLLFVSMA